MANNPIAIDASDLQYYDKQIKMYIEDKDAEVKASLSSSLDGLREEVNKISNKADLNEAAINAANVHIDENEAAILILQNDDKLIQKEIADLRVLVENKLDESAMEYLATKSDLEGLATEEYVKDKIREAQLEAGDIDLSEYAKISDVDALSKRIDDQNNAIIAIHAEIDSVQNNLDQYITESELAARNYATLDKLESYATKDYVADAISNIPEVDLSSYATKSELEAVQNVAGSNSVKLFAIESEIFDINEQLETIPSIEGLASEQFVLDKISEIEIPEVPTKLSELENDAGFITEIPSEYVTESELDSKGYITEHQSLENYATKEFVENSIESINIPDTSKFATKDDLTNLATVEYVTNNYISNTEAENFATHTELEEVVTEVVDTHFEETVILHVDEEIEKKLAENQAIMYGTFGEV